MCACVCAYVIGYARSTLHLCSSIMLYIFWVDIFRFMPNLLILFDNFYKNFLCCSHTCSCVCVCACVCVCEEKMCVKKFDWGHMDPKVLIMDVKITVQKLMIQS